MIISPSDKGVGVVVMISSVYNQNLMDLFYNNKNYKEISPQTILKMWMF